MSFLKLNLPRLNSDSKLLLPEAVVFTSELRELMLSSN